MNVGKATPVSSKHNGPIKCSERSLTYRQSNGRKTKRGKMHIRLAMIGSCFARDWLNNDELVAYFDWVSTKCNGVNLIISLFDRESDGSAQSPKLIAKNSFTELEPVEYLSGRGASDGNRKTVKILTILSSHQLTYPHLLPDKPIAQSLFF